MKTIVNVDIQPEYQKNITFDIHNWVKYINRVAKQNNIVFLYNGYDTMGMIDRNSYIEWLYNLGINESVINDAIFYDKSYAFFRNAMDKGMDEDQISDLVKFMIKNNINDSRDIENDLWNEYENIKTRDLLEGSEDMICIPDVMDELDYYSNIHLLGRAANECLKEIEIALTALNKKYNLLNQFIY